MHELGRLLISLALAGAALTVLGGGVIWSLNETRRIRRSLRRVLGEPPHAMLAAPGRGRGVGCNFTSNQIAVTWDIGAWCLIYRLDELVGAEVIVDGRVEARAWRGEERRPLDCAEAERQVELRFVFDDPRHPDFGLLLWEVGDEERKGAYSPREAVREANRWIALVEAVLRRPVARRPVVGAEPDPEQEPLPFHASDPAEDAELTG